MRPRILSAQRDSGTHVERAKANADGPRRPATISELGFVPQAMVRWLDPHQLLDTSTRVLASGFLTSYTDSRELQVNMTGDVYDRSESDELWLDYVADLGDGWNSTYTVARLLAQPQLDLSHGNERHRTQRGSILVMGGDLNRPGFDGGSLGWVSHAASG